MKGPACHGLRIKYIMMELDEGVMGRDKLSNSIDAWTKIALAMLRQ